MVTTSQTPPKPFTLMIGDDPVYSLDTDRRRIGIGTRQPQRRVHIVTPDEAVLRVESAESATATVELTGSGGTGTISYNSATGQWSLGTDLESTDTNISVDVLSVPDGGASAARIEVGTGGDLKLYHDGANSFVSAASGSLVLRTSINAINIGSSGSCVFGASVSMAKGLTVNTTAASSALVVDDGTGDLKAGNDSGTPNLLVDVSADRVALNRVAALGVLHIKTTSSAMAIPTLYLEQQDVDEPFINYEGSSAASAATNISTWTTGATLQGYVRVAINGTDRWMPFYDAPTS